MNLEEFRSKGKERPYEYYKAINENLTLKMYNYLRGNGSLWKISCGHGVKIKYDNEELKPLWYLDTPECYENRFRNYYEDDNEENKTK